MLISEYKPLKIPDDMSEGLLFKYAKGKDLDVFGEIQGVKRRKYEPSFLYKIRIRNEAIKEKINVQCETSCALK